MCIRDSYNAQITPWLEVVSATGGDTIRIQTDNYYTGNGSAPSVRSEYITRPGDQQYDCLLYTSNIPLPHRILRYSVLSRP